MIAREMIAVNYDTIASDLIGDLVMRDGMVHLGLKENSKD